MSEKSFCSTVAVLEECFQNLDNYLLYTTMKPEHENVFLTCWRRPPPRLDCLPHTHTQVFTHTCTSDHISHHHRKTKIASSPVRWAVLPRRTLRRVRGEQKAGIFGCSVSKRRLVAVQCSAQPNITAASKDEAAAVTKEFIQLGDD